MTPSIAVRLRAAPRAMRPNRLIAAAVVEINGFLDQAEAPTTAAGSDGVLPRMSQAGRGNYDSRSTICMHRRECDRWPGVATGVNFAERCTAATRAVRHSCSAWDPSPRTRLPVQSPRTSRFSNGLRSDRRRHSPLGQPRSGRQYLRAAGQTAATRTATERQSPPVDAISRDERVTGLRPFVCAGSLVRECGRVEPRCAPLPRLDHPSSR